MLPGFPITGTTLNYEAIYMAKAIVEKFPMHNIVQHDGSNVEIRSKSPQDFPHSWAGEWGEDEFGLYQVLIFKGVEQVLRWIEPGRFMMGSPESEAKRGNNELEHEVILTKGYWLADTACTQELWEAVMGENPSNFKQGAGYPVEKVSWNDCEEFLQKINSLVPELKLCLPTEAQWEYACRAGTPTPFSFGDTITTEQVNYNGNYPYAGRRKGEYRQKTVAVKSVPSNPWGLYEMHGNVYEWCSDWFDDYPATSMVDPMGPLEGVSRVQRGGSWVSGGRFVRSAYRAGGGPSFRYDYSGFRLARGQ